MADGYDLMIKGGMVVDGTGSPWLKKDIGIVKDRIVKIGRIDGAAKKTIDAKDKVVAPGFVDLHSHTDHNIIPCPDAESFIMMGVTTAVVGNCGLTLAPTSTKTLPLLRRYLDPFLQTGFKYDWDWRTLAEFYERVEKQGTGLNLVPLVGQGTIRLAVKGLEPGAATRNEMREMKRLLEESLESGAFGMSSGLIYAPGSYCEPEELIELASVLKKYGGLYTTHMRNEGDRLVESVDETIRVGEVNDIPIEISHHKALGKTNWGKVNATLRMLEDARRRGVDIGCDAYPYIATSTSISAIMPPWLLEGGVDRLLERIKDPELREKAKNEIIDGSMKGSNAIKAAGWHGIRIAGCPSNHNYEGKSIGEILEMTHRFTDPFKGFFDFVLEINGNAKIISFSIDEDDLRTVLSHPLTAFISDAGAMAPRMGGKPHPRTYGTFPRVLAKYVREEKRLPLEEVVRKMTALPAGRAGISERGILREGLYADVVVFDPATIQDKATFDEPHQYPDGIDYVIVNGEAAVENGKLTRNRAGRVLRRK
jgi:N-acyl-D-amino-acid deacylase